MNMEEWLQPFLKQKPGCNYSNGKGMKKEEWLQTFLKHEPLIMQLLKGGMNEHTGMTADIP